MVERYCVASIPVFAVESVVVAAVGVAEGLLLASHFEMGLLEVRGFVVREDRRLVVVMFVEDSQGALPAIQTSSHTRLTGITGRPFRLLLH